MARRSYTYGSSTIPDYLKVILTPPANGWAKPDEGLYLEKAGDSAGIHIEYNNIGVTGSIDGNITATATPMPSASLAPSTTAPSPTAT